MCGISGLMFLRGEIDVLQIEHMTNAISHRGPDDEGYFLGNTKTGEYDIAGGKDTPKNIYSSDFHYSPDRLLRELPRGIYNFVMSNRRLAIHDLTPAGHQPMANDNKSIWIVYNGEIYNFREIREELMVRGHRFHSSCDTEVIIKAYQEWDVNCLNKFNGMWAFCIWDINKRILFCARDRLGIKPFYYYFDNGLFAFSSEIKPLLGLNLPRRPNDSLIYDFLKYGMLDHTDETFFQGIKKLSQGHFMRVSFDGDIMTDKYWDLGVSDMLDGVSDDSTYAEDLRDLFVDSVRLRLRSDVPIGSCLSGGLDSSSIVCVANKLLFPADDLSANERQKTFSSCFSDKRYDERVYIEEVIQKTHAEKNFVFPKPEEFLSELYELLLHQEEPFGGTSIYAQWCVFKKARERGVTVMLDGQGADEQLGGYRKFYMFYFLHLLNKKRFVKLALESIKFFSSVDVIKTLNIRKGLKYLKLGHSFFNFDGFFVAPFNARLGDDRINIGYTGSLGTRIKDDLLKFSLPVLLRYEDKNSMAHSIEARLPFLDYRLVEKVAAFPITQKLQNGWTKYALRNAMIGILPEKIRRRKSKLGFVTPEETWFKIEMSREIEKVFNNARFIPQYCNTEELTRSLKKYIAGHSFSDGDTFFRYFILELWGRKFGLN